MNVAWTKHLPTEKEKQDFTNEVLGSKRVLERLSEIILELDKDIELQELSPKAYDSPNWSYRQAHANGMKAALRKIQTLITPDQALRKS
jgi:hypothetical protein